MLEISSYTGDDAAKVISHKKNALSSQLLLRRLQRHHYEQAPESYKSRCVPSTIVGNPLLNLCNFMRLPPPPALNDDALPDCVMLEEYRTVQAGSIKTVLTVVSHYYNVSIERVIGRSNTAPTVRARHVAMYLASECTTHSAAGMGRAFAKDHTVILYAAKKIAKEITENQILALQVSIMRQQINALDSMPTQEMVQAARSKRIKHRFNSNWTLEREVLLVRQAREGKGWAEIGRMLGVSGSKACGKYQRLTAAADVMQAASNP